ncbi:MAG: cyclic nucleotide-binding domain-containing protein [Elusimicrobia bacterium]|nr:cyclic nucleotide-binding domain-containing protein [Elusimicrobiota bacterium]
MAAKEYPRDRRTLVARLGQLNLFSGLSKKELVGVLAITTWKKLTEGTVIFEEGGPGTAVYLIERGKVLISKNQKNAEPQDVAILSDGDFFGEMSLLQSGPRSATAKALEDTLIVVIEGRELLRWVKKNPSLSVDVGIKVLRATSERLRQTTQDMSVFHRLTESILEAKTKEKIFELTAGALGMAIGPKEAGGWVLYAYNPHLEEFHPERHAGDVPGELLVNKKELPGGRAEFSVYHFGSNGSLVVFKPNSRALLKSTPLLKAVLRLAASSLANVISQTESELRLRLKSPSVSA